MLFNSYTFAIFFVIVLFAYHLPVVWQAKKWWLLLASYLFYSAWNPLFLLLLWLSTVVDYWLGRKMATARSVVVRHGCLLASLSVNLGLLGFFKYADFFSDTFIAIAGDRERERAGWDIVLPVGISFYTFQTLSYTIDVYRGRLSPARSLLDFATYVAFFPQLVAGPIVRAGDFLPQLRSPRRCSANDIGWGMTLVLVGLFQKVALADGILAPIADTVYSQGAAIGCLDAWCGTLAFAGQIFCDFSGYSTTAIGLARCMGFRVPDNFRYPLAAIGFSDFWRRWHISLSAWMRDYLYVPLGGNRQGMVRTAVALMVTMVLGGLWHGAAWTFVAWGALHGLLLLVEHLLRSIVPAASRQAKGMKVVGLLMTFFTVSFSWVLFRSRTFEQAFSLFEAMLAWPAITADQVLTLWQRYEALGVVAVLAIYHLWMRERSFRQLFLGQPWPCRAVALATMIYWVTASSGGDRAFIYFQF